MLRFISSVNVFNVKLLFLSHVSKPALRCREFQWIVTPPPSIPWGIMELLLVLNLKKSQKLTSMLIIMETSRLPYHWISTTERWCSRFGVFITGDFIQSRPVIEANNLFISFSRNSPHNFKKQNTESTSVAKEQDALTTDFKYKSHLVQLTIPTLSNGVVSVETNLEVKKPKTTVEKLESLYIISSPV